jgi:hypothetical protein
MIKEETDDRRVAEKMYTLNKVHKINRRRGKKGSLKNRDKIVFILLMCFIPLHTPQIIKGLKWVGSLNFMDGKLRPADKQRATWPDGPA